MRLYRIEFDTQDIAGCIAWAGTQADAKLKQKELEAMHGRHNVGNFTAVDVPTDKTGLLDWLNHRAAL